MVSTCPLPPLGVGIPVVVDDVEGAESVGAVRSEGGEVKRKSLPVQRTVQSLHTPGRLRGAMRPVGVVGGKRNVPN